MENHRRHNQKSDVGDAGDASTSINNLISLPLPLLPLLPPSHPPFHFFSFTLNKVQWPDSWNFALFSVLTIRFLILTPYKTFCFRSLILIFYCHRCCFLFFFLIFFFFFLFFFFIFFFLFFFYFFFYDFSNRRMSWPCLQWPFDKCENISTCWGPAVVKRRRPVLV